MLKTNLTIALRNLWKHRGFSLVNILGLSISLAGCILILLYVQHERSYDAWNPDAANVYRLAAHYSHTPSEVDASSPAELAPALAPGIPAIAHYTRFYVWDMGRRLLTYGERSTFIEQAQGVDSTFFQVFPYSFVEGDPAHALDGPGSLVISETLAKRLFGNQPALGKQVLFQAKKTMAITGVFRAPATPTHFPADAFQRMSSSGDGWGNGNYYTYIRVTPGTNPSVLQQNINRVMDGLPINSDTIGTGVAHAVLVPLRDMYFRSDILYDFTDHGNAQILQILLAVALLLLAIACINFTNFNITQSVRRSRETGIRKVLGAHRLSLALYYLLETTMQVLVSMLLAIVWAELFLPSLNNLLGTHLALFENGAWRELGLLSVAGVCVVSLSGGYVAYYISGLEPTKVLKGGFTNRDKGTMIRKVLLVAQFAFASLAVGALMVIHTQEHFMENLDPGFNKDQVMIINTHGHGHMTTFEGQRQRLLALPGVQMATKVNFLPGDKAIQVQAGRYNGESVPTLDVVTVGYDFFEVMGMHFIKGRPFTRGFGQDSAGIIVNETAARLYHLDTLLGKPWMNGWPVLGIVKDVNQRGFETAAEPTAYHIEIQNSNSTDHILLKVDGHRLPETIRALTGIWKDIEPGFPLDYHFMDDQFSRMFIQYRQMDVVFMAFSGLTLFIALLGIFVLSAFIALQRSREIGIRKSIGRLHRRGHEITQPGLRDPGAVGRRHRPTRPLGPGRQMAPGFCLPGNPTLVRLCRNRRADPHLHIGHGFNTSLEGRRGRPGQIAEI